MSEPSGWLPGLIALLAVTGSFVLSGHLLRRLIVSGWSGPPALLADLVLGLSLMLVSAQLVGIAGLLSRPALLIAGGLTLLACSAAFRLRGQGTEGGEPAGATPGRITVPLAIAIAALLLVASGWITPTLNSLEAGMYGGDTLWYHMPFSAHFAQTGSITGLLFIDTQYLHSFYPQNSEMVHAIGIVLVGSDFLSPVINYFWLAFGVLAGWCVGRSFGMALPATLSVTLLMSMEVISAREPGGANNDAMVIALLLAAVALAATAWRTVGPGPGDPGPGEPVLEDPVPEDPGPAIRRTTLPASAKGPLLIAGLAIGLAIGTKLTALAPGFVLLAGLVLLVKRGSRLRLGSVMALAAAATGAFWFIRNLVQTGNPLPWLSIGPFEKAGELTGREPRPIVDYLADLSIWSEWLAPGLSDRLGPFWLTLLVCALVGLGLGLLSRDRLRIVVAASGCAALVAYVLIPLGAAGPEGSPTAFAVNVRYATPALALGFISLALPPRWIEGRTWGIGISWFFLLALGVSIFAGPGLSPDGYPATGLLAAFALLLVIPIAVTLLWMTGSRAPAAIVGLVWLAGIAALGSWQSDRYLDFRYSAASPRYPEMTYPSLELQQGIGPLNELARDLEGERIGLSGSLAQYYQYGIWGSDLSNEVEAVGVKTGRRDLRPPESCREWIQALREGDFDLVVTSPPVPDRDPEATTTAAEEGWIGENSAELLLKQNKLAVWRLDRRSTDFRVCAAR